MSCMHACMYGREGSKPPHPHPTRMYVCMHDRGGSEPPHPPAYASVALVAVRFLASATSTSVVFCRYWGSCQWMESCPPENPPLSLPGEGEGCRGEECVYSPRESRRPTNETHIYMYICMYLLYLNICIDVYIFHR